MEVTSSIKPSICLFLHPKSNPTNLSYSRFFPNPRTLTSNHLSSFRFSLFTTGGGDGGNGGGRGSSIRFTKFEDPDDWSSNKVNQAAKQISQRKKQLSVVTDLVKKWIEISITCSLVFIVVKFSLIFDNFNSIDEQAVAPKNHFKQLAESEVGNAKISADVMIEKAKTDASYIKRIAAIIRGL